jgi:hypothetical protein
MTSVTTHNNPSNIFPQITQQLIKEKKTVCRGYKKIIPNLQPFISSLSSSSAQFNSHIKIYVYGEHFFPFGITTVDFGSIQDISINYVNTNSFYFEVPLLAFPGIYNVTVKNRIRLNSRNVTSNAGGLIITSNTVEFTITS